MLVASDVGQLVGALSGFGEDNQLGPPVLRVLAQVEAFRASSEPEDDYAGSTVSPEIGRLDFTPETET